MAEEGLRFERAAAEYDVEACYINVLHISLPCYH